MPLAPPQNVPGKTRPLSLRGPQVLQKPRSAVHGKHLPLQQLTLPLAEVAPNHHGYPLWIHT